MEINWDEAPEGRPRYKPGRLSTFVFDEETMARHDARVKADALDAAWLSLSAQAGGPEGHIPKSQRYLLNLLRKAADSLKAEAEGKS